MDFTLKVYKQLLQSLKFSGYNFITLERYFTKGLPEGKVVILRHDVDRKPHFALNMAKIEYSLDIQSSYYFRIVKESYSPHIINNIVSMNHELGYHYEDLALSNGDFESAIDLFRQNLENFRSFYPVRTACMHGNPLSKWDNRMIWEKYNYKDFGIIGEPYYDMDFKKILYLTDTGRRWDNKSMNIRDRVEDHFNLTFSSTMAILSAIDNGKIPFYLFINTHPERWTDSLFPWFVQLFVQNVKNIIKKKILKRRVS